MENDIKDITNMAMDMSNQTNNVMWRWKWGVSNG